MKRKQLWKETGENTAISRYLAYNLSIIHLLFLSQTGQPGHEIIVLLP